MLTNCLLPNDTLLPSIDDSAFSLRSSDLIRTDVLLRRDHNGANPENRLPAWARDRADADAKALLIEISPAAAFKRRAVSWTGMTAEFIESTSRVRSEFRFRAPVHLLIVHEQGARHSGETFLQGLPTSKLRDFTRRFTLAPAGHEYHDWFEPRSLTRITCIYLDPAKLPLPSNAQASEEVFAPRMFFEDAALWDTAQKLRNLVDSPAAEDRLYFAALGAVLVHELVRLNQRAPSAQPRLRGGLAAWQQRIVTAFIDEHLAEQVPLATLAGLVRLSPFHFCRAFKQSFGVPPHRYHSNRRIERAKSLLAAPDFSVTDIGLTIGFSETSSFTTAFRKATGMTPTRYHRSLTAI